MRPTAYVSHYDCSRHDTGWRHPDHQGRLSEISRAVHRDMLTLHGSLLHVEGRHATDDELLLAHTSEYLAGLTARVAEAADRGRPVESSADLVVSAATLDASRAAAGCALEAVDVVVAGRARNAFCAVRPPARDAGAAEPGRFGFVNPVAVAARGLRARGEVDRILVVEWGAAASAETILAGSGIRVVGPGGGPPRDGADFADRLPDVLARAIEGFRPDFLLLSAGFEWLEGDPIGGASLAPRDYYEATRRVRQVAEEHCGGRLVSVLDGGSAAGGLGAAVVQHLRALADLPPAGNH